MIRDFDAADLKGVQKLLLSVPEAVPWCAGDLLASTTNLILRIAENEGAICGFLAFRITADEAEILNLAVDSAARRRGVGSQLMKDAMEACKTARVKKIFLEVRDSNHPARNFYSQMGFTHVGRRREYYRQPAEDALILVHTVE